MRGNFELTFIIGCKFENTVFLALVKDFRVSNSSGLPTLSESISSKKSYYFANATLSVLYTAFLLVCSLVFSNFLRSFFLKVIFSITSPLCEKCLNMEFFLVRIRESTDQKKLRIWTLFFLSGFCFKTIHESQDCRGRGRAFL